MANILKFAEITSVIAKFIVRPLIEREQELIF